MVGTDPEAGGVEGIQPFDPAAKGAAFHPPEALLREPGEGLRPGQHRRADLLRYIAVAAAGEHGAAVNGLEAPAEGAVDAALVIELQI